MMILPTWPPLRPRCLRMSVAEHSLRRAKSRAQSNDLTFARQQAIQQAIDTPVSLFQGNESVHFGRPDVRLDGVNRLLDDETHSDGCREVHRDIRAVDKLGHRSHVTAVRLRVR